MSRLSDLLRAASQLDPQLAKDLEEEIQPLQKRLPFGLNFERHAPEAVELAGHKIRKGSKVRVLPRRGDTSRGDRRLWRVTSLDGAEAHITTPAGDGLETAHVALDDLILVAEFRDRIYPGLRADGVVENGKGKPFHTVINGENFHVLEQLTFTHEGAVDAIYIDPPYNTGARDWKYNNDYVEGDDLYRHSKWLAFMQRRLEMAKRLLNPDDSVLIVTIDEKEFLRLGLLLEQTFPNARIQMVSTQINPQGTSSGTAEFSRVNEYIFFVVFGDAELTKWSRSMIDNDKEASDVSMDRTVRWADFARYGANASRLKSPGAFFPIFVDVETETVHSVGDAVGWDVDPTTVPTPVGTRAVWPPKRPDGSDGRWRTVAESCRELIAKGYLKVGPYNARAGRHSFAYLQGGTVESIESGEIEILGRDAKGSVIVQYSSGAKRATPKTMWTLPSHDASRWGANLLQQLLPGRRFPFPKSLFAVEDALRFYVKSKPEAVIVDFFAGSGTTAHAVMRLNKQDNGRRQCISVTNNEVAADEQASLRRGGLRPGDAEWERHGICEQITKPRIRAAITGRTPDNELIKGDYKFVDEFPMAEGFQENAAFFTLTYESPFMVSTDRAFAAIAPMLWLRAGARGERIDSIEGGWAVAESYGILRDLDQTAEFIEALNGREGLRIAYVVTDDEGRYQQVASELKRIETVRLYEDYLRNCESTGDF
ncbi:site-specific DNA-methyltransferase [Microbacterium sp. HMWF026]|uniref:site-specific DNA-methyltransferase n=1 Tax=Microbacterium sp. HMWF026 TaxID=2056861 RepID=UPI000D35CCC4|nr:DNA methyltransferase [Microbacterium sp. HMWF026]PTT21703.1 site-specific DNA-methyltransferase [Microbacterium sp. HMWF026]